ncbi:MAG: hypothetical protein DCC65_04445 [Planctomycetota bacterium]|nr:MAG: hypothetical protein DCC65_04445 [Planctomycetota bacterium]
MAKPTKSAAKKSTPAKSSAAKAKTKAAAKAPAPKAKPPEKTAKSKPLSKAKAPREAVPEMPAAAKRGAAREHREEAVEKPVVPAKPLVDSEFTTSMRDALAAQRQRLLAVVQTTQAQMAEKSGDLADLSDRASEGFEDELDMGLMAIEAAQLEDIEAAIQRIDEGSYGLCVDCAKAIPRKRLEVLPFARRCLACEGQAERRMKVVEEEAEEEDFD